MGFLEFKKRDSWDVVSYLLFIWLLVFDICFYKLIVGIIKEFLILNVLEFIDFGIDVD